MGICSGSERKNSKRNKCPESSSTYKDLYSSKLNPNSKIIISK